MHKWTLSDWFELVKSVLLLALGLAGLAVVVPLAGLVLIPIGLAALLFAAAVRLLASPRRKGDCKEACHEGR